MTIWSTTNKAASITLSGSNLIATKTGNSDAIGIADTGYSTGKRVFSIVMNVKSDASPALSRVASGLTTYPGDNATSLAVISGSGFYYNGVITGPAPTIVSGNTVFLAVDFTNSRLWWRVGTGGQWNGSGTANPDTNVGGFNMSALQASGALYPAAGFFSAGGQQTLDPTASGHGLTTFTPWDAAGAQTLLPGLFSNTQSFYGPTVTVGAVFVQPPLYANTQTFYGATVTQAAGAQTLLPSLYSNAQTFYGPTAVRGAVNVTPTLFTNAQSFYPATVTLAGGTQTLIPSLFTNTNTFFPPTIIASGVAFAVGGGGHSQRDSKERERREKQKWDYEKRREADETREMEKTFDRLTNPQKAKTPKAIVKPVAEVAEVNVEFAPADPLAAVNRARDEEAIVLLLLAS